MRGLFGLLLCTACCDGVAEEVTADPFAGIRGRMYAVGGGCGDDACPSPGSGWIRVLATDRQQLIAELPLDDSGNFESALDPGTYWVEAAPATARLDRAIGELTITATSGHRIVRRYTPQFAPNELIVVFSAGVDEQRAAEILASHGLVQEAGFLPEVLVRFDGVHPEVVGEGLVAEFPGEVERFAPSFFACAH